MDEEPKIELETTPEPQAPVAEPAAETPPAQPAKPATEAPAAEPAPPVEAAAAPAKGGGSGLIIAIVAIAVVAVVVIAFMFMGGGGIEGKWTVETIEVYDQDGNLNEAFSDLVAENMGDHWMEFKSDGSAVSGNETGPTPDTDSTWEASDGKLTITSTSIEVNSVYNSTTGNTTWNNETVTDTVVFEYSISGNTLTLEMEMEGMTVKYIAKRT